MLNRSLRLLVSILVISLSGAYAQAEMYNQMVNYQVSLDSAYNTQNQAAVVASHDVSYPGAGGIRIHFYPSELGYGNYLKLTYGTGQVLYLDDQRLYEFNYKSPYLNGELVRVELVVAAGSATSGAFIQGLEVPYNVETESICGSEDNRIPSDLKPFARMVSAQNGRSGCSATMIGPSCAVSAGHCTSVLNVAQFNVPASNDNGQPNFPAPEHQYPLSEHIASNDGGIGRDWAVFRLKKNPITGKYPGEVQGFLSVNYNPPTEGMDLQITGYGTDRPDPTRNAAQQTNIGPLISVEEGTARMFHQVDTMPGNSGSSVLAASTQEIIGIHTHGGCRANGGNNGSTSLAFNRDFQNAVRECLAADAELWHQLQ